MNTAKTVKKRTTLNLDKATLDTLSKIAKINAYETMSATIRIMVKKYAKQELPEQ